MNSKSAQTIFTALILCLFLLTETNAQTNLPFLRVSPKAKVSQNIEFASVEISYSRPSVQGREIWGTLVPYGLAPNPFGNGKPMPWRAGANENTVVTLSHDAMINGNKLAAGSYGLHMLVHENEWTVIFSKDNNAWGSFFYEEKNDALRFKVKPTESHFEEWLMYGFDNITPNSCNAYLHWGNVKVSFKVEFDKNKVVLDTYRDLLTNLGGFNPAAWATAANYCLTNNTNVDEGMAWIDKALSMAGGVNFNNNVIKAGLLKLKGNVEEGEKIIAASIETSTEAELNNYGYQVMNQGNLDEAIKIFELNVKRFPQAFNTYDSLGEALNNKGDKKGAKENYEKAYELAPANQKARIENVLKGL